MREQIQGVLKTLEMNKDMKVLYACESGSRAWGLSSEASDYDVRFIYVHNREWYLSIDQGKDVLEVPGSALPSGDSILDMSGWELTKALRLFRKSNPSLLEWLHSSIVYTEPFSTIERMRELEKKIFSPISCMYHYLKMAKGNFWDICQGKNINVKKYLNVIRPLLITKWIEINHTFPPIELHLLVERLLPSGILKEEIEALLNRKMAGEELKVESKMDRINEYVEKEIEHLEIYIRGLKNEVPNPTESLNQLFREALNEVWGK
ncbi:nucleotidyltransferase domain-containing protein [Neobacillus niacini]|uniref:nucleotidyltransferase domain-containing protein n=1 Tax=Neobacillus niacini TaxID=86668 RepID=UPI00285E0180|nr:nucleotidyltransferase domain-containing protein [Neobacillus niacini]MDR7001975.1 putative nucleotidyltransferase [Neobacillus niacini]